MGLWAQRTIRPAWRPTNSAWPTAQKNGRLGSRLSRPARELSSAGRLVGSARPMSCSSARGTGPVESGGPSSSSPLLFFPFLLLPFTGEPGPRGSASSSSLLHSSPPMDLGRGARLGTAWRGLLGGSDDGGLVVWSDTMAGRGRGGDGNKDSTRVRSRVTGELDPRRRAGAKVRPGWTALGSADLAGDGGVVKAQALKARRAGYSRTRGVSVLRARGGDTAAGLR